MGGRWATPPPGLVLGSAEVHVWRARLDVPPEGVRALEPMLASAERQRAARFRWPADRHRFIVARSALRAILAGYLRLDPRGIHLTADIRGKPRLASADALCFNLSHSADLALYALARHCEVGVDLERVLWVRPPGLGEALRSVEHVLQAGGFPLVVLRSKV